MGKAWFASILTRRRGTRHKPTKATCVRGNFRKPVIVFINNSFNCGIHCLRRVWFTDFIQRFSNHTTHTSCLASFFITRYAPAGSTHESEKMEDDAPPKKKRSRFFSGGKSLIGTIQSNLQDRDTSAAETALKSEEKPVGITSATVTKPNNGSESADDEPQGDSDMEPLELGRVSTAAAALQKLSVNPNAKRRQGIGPDAFKELTSKALLPTAAPPAQKTNSAFSTSSTNLQPRLIVSTNVPPTRWPPARPAGTDALRRKYREEQEGPNHRHLQGQPSTLNSSQQPSTRPVFPNLHTQAQNLVLPPREEPSKSAQTRPDVAQPSLPRKYDSTTTDQPASRPIGNIPNTGITNLPLHATLTPTRTPRANGTSLGRLRSTVSPTLYMSPNRLENAVAASRKRKRTGIILPPPAYIYTRTNSPNFNIFPAILLYPEICFHLSTHLPLNSLVALYAISRDFHTILDSRFTTVILSQSLAKAPESSRVFPFRCYAHLCRKDPASRIPHPDPVKARAGISRAVPSFRWLRMVLWREKVVHEIMAIMAEDGVPLPSRCSLALKRMWVNTLLRSKHPSPLHHHVMTDITPTVYSRHSRQRTSHRLHPLEHSCS
jgi:hypothetical protein